MWAATDLDGIRQAGEIEITTNEPTGRREPGCRSGWCRRRRCRRPLLPWRRGGLAPTRHRSPTRPDPRRASLTATGNIDQLAYHLGLTKQNGATETELIETITHLAFYAGWPKAMSAMGVAKQVLQGQQLGKEAHS